MASRLPPQQHDRFSQPKRLAKRGGRGRLRHEGPRFAPRQQAEENTAAAEAREAARGAAVPQETLRTPTRPRWRRYWYLPVFAAYVVIVGVTVAHHEPWFDEAQAWLIARDATWSDLLCTLPRYEGSPMLWHLLLALPARCGLPFASLNVIAAAIACGGVLMFLARSPLPKFLAATAPFTFFLVYQHAAVARSYVLMPLLLFTCADLYPSRFRRPLLFVAPLGLLAHVSAHGLFIAAGLAGLLGFQALRRWRRERDAAALQRAALALGLFGLVAAAAAWQLRPPPDHYGGLGYQQPLWPTIQFALERWSGALADAYVPSLAVFAISVAWFWRTGALAIYALLTAAVLVLFVIANCWFHHEGILFFVWLFALWISFQEFRSPGFRETQRTARLRRGLSAAVAVVFALHVYWAFVSIREDFFFDYSGAKAVAEYLKREGLDSKRIATSDIYALAGQPYFDKNFRFANFRNGRGSSFVVFANEYFHPSGLFRFPQPYQEPFDVLILGVKQPPFCSLPWDDPAFELPLSSDFRCVGYFPGNLWWKTDVYERDDYVCYVRKELQASRHEPSAAAAARREVRVRNLERFGIEPEDEIGVPLAAAHAILGRMLELLDRQAAIEHFRAALQLWPGSATHAALGGILAKTNPGEASQHLQTALSLNPNNASAYANLGYIHARAGRYDAAIVCYRNALALEPDLPAVRDGLAAVLKIVRGDRQGAGAAETGNNPP